MTHQDPRFSDIDEESSIPPAPEHTQDAISSMLRDAARSDHGPDTRMPADVESRIRAALSAAGMATSSSSELYEDRTPSESHTGQPRVMVPLPGGGQRKTSNSTAVREDISPATHRPREGSSEAVDAPAVSSLDAHRQRKRGFSRTALSLGAAAAVALGALGVWHVTEGTSPNHSTSAAASSSSGSPEVRVTNSETQYTSAAFTSQAASLPEQRHPAITSMAQAREEGLGTLATPQGLETCVGAIDSVLTGKPDKIYADFGTYNGRPAVVVVVVKNGTKTAWAVNRTCTKESDARTSAHQLTT